MSIYVLFLVLTAAVLHATWNLLAKKTKGGVPFIWLQYVAGSILYLPLLFIPFLKQDIVYSTPLLWFSLSSAVLHLAYFIVLQKGYRTADLSVVYPLARGSGPLFSFIAAILFLHESLRVRVAIGLLLIIAGVLTITGLSFKRNDNNKTKAGVLYGVITGFFIALYTLNDTIAIRQYQLSPLVLTLATNCLSAVLLLPFAITKKAELKREIKLHKWIIIIIAVLSPAAYMLVLHAVKFAPLTVVAPARETSILFGVLMGSRVFNEEDGKRRLIAGMLILIGIMALSIGK